MGRKGTHRRSTPLAAVLTIGVASAVWLAPGQVAARQTPAATDLIAVGGAYVKEFISRFSSVVAEERYVQRLPTQRLTRNLVSDFLIVQLPESNDWTSFRDVFEVDGKPVRDRDERLVKLFLEPGSATRLERARAIALEGARYNIRGIGTVNNPLLAMAFIQERYRDRFRWRVVRNDKDVGPTVWSVRFEEYERPFLLRLDGNRELQTTGLLWIDAPTGRILKSELRVELGASVAGGGILVRNRSEVTTTFALDDRFEIAVPVEMRENHFFGDNDISTVATYGRFRRFGVQTEERVQP